MGYSWIHAAGERHDAPFRDEDLLGHPAVAAHAIDHVVATGADLCVPGQAETTVATGRDRLDGYGSTVLEEAGDLVPGSARDRESAVEDRHVRTADTTGPDV